MGDLQSAFFFGYISSQIPGGWLGKRYGTRVLLTLMGLLWAGAMVVTARSDRAKQLVDELKVWAQDESSIFLFTEPDPLFYERMPWNAETIVLPNVNVSGSTSVLC